MLNLRSAVFPCASIQPVTCLSQAVEKAQTTGGREEVAIRAMVFVEIFVALIGFVEGILVFGFSVKGA